MILGGPLPTFSAYYTGFMNGEGLLNLGNLNTLTFTPTDTSKVGTTPITTTGAVTSSDYAIVYRSGTLTIKPKTTTIIVGLPPSKKL